MSTTQQNRRWIWPVLLLMIVFGISLYYFHWRLEPAPRFILGNQSKVRVLDVSPDSHLMAVANDDQVLLCRIETGEQYASIPLAGRSIEHAIFTPDGKRLIINSFSRNNQGEKQSALIYLIATGQKEAEIPLSNRMDRAFNYKKSRSMVVSQDSRYLACLVPFQPDRPNWCSIKLWDLASGKEKAKLEEKSVGHSTPLVFSPDSRYLAAGISRPNEKIMQVKVWEVAAVKLARTYAVPPTTGQNDFAKSNPASEPVQTLAFSPDSQTLVGMPNHNTFGYDGQLFVWNITTDRLQKSLSSSAINTGGNDPLLYFTFDGNKLLISLDHPLMTAAMVCDLSGPEPRKETTFTSAILSEDGKFLAARAMEEGRILSEKPAILLTDLTSNQTRTLCQYPWSHAMMTPLAFSPGNQFLAVQRYYLLGQSWYDSVLDYLLEPERRVHVHSVPGGTLLGRVPGHDARFTPDGRTLIAYEEKVKGMEVEKGGVIRVYDVPLSHPWPAILGGALLTTLPFGLLMAWRYRRSSQPGRG